MPSGLYPGKGVKLPLASSNPQEPVWASMRVATYVIPSASFSMGTPLNAGLTTSMNALFASAPAGTAIEVYYDIGPTFATEYLLDSIAASADRVYTWSTQSGYELDGFIRFKNTGGQNISEIYIQQRARTDG